MSDNWYVGRSAIIGYLRRYLNLSTDNWNAWRAIRRFNKQHWQGTMIILLPSNRPALDPEAFQLWWARYKKHYVSLKTKEQVGKNLQ